MKKLASKWKMEARVGKYALYLEMFACKIRSFCDKYGCQMKNRTNSFNSVCVCASLIVTW